MLTKIKSWLITAGVFAITILTLGIYARHQKNKAIKASMESKRNEILFNEAIQHKHDIQDSYGLSPNDVDERLRPDYRDR